MKDFLDFCQHRRSIRKFKPSSVNVDDLVDICIAGSFAPSLGDLQPWNFVIVRDPDKRQALANTCEDFSWVQDAPVMIAVVANYERAKTYFGEDSERLCRDSCAAAVQNMLLTIHDKGLGSCWVTKFSSDASSVLEIKPGFELVALLPIGFPDEPDLLPKDINSLRELVYFDRFGNQKVDEASRFWDYGEVVQTKTREIQDQVDRHVNYHKKKSEPAVSSFREKMSSWMDKTKRK